MIDAGKAIAYLDLDISGFSRGIKTSKQLAGDLGNASLNASTKIKALGSGMKVVGTLASTLSAALIAAGTAAGTMSMHLDTSARKVTTIADTSIMSLGQVKSEARALGAELGVMPTQLTEALYNTISATNDTASAMGVVEVATKAAVGGFTDAATAVDGLTTVTNAYGMQGAAAVRTISDQMLIAQNYGKTTFGEIASSIGNVIPLAAQLKVGTNELFGAIAALTRQGIGTSESITGLKAAFSNIIKPAAEAEKLAKSLGLEFNATALESKGLAGFLSDIAQKTGGSTEKMSKLFGSVEALNAVLALTGTDGAKYFAGALDAMAGAAGATDAAFETMAGGAEGKLNRVKVQLSNITTMFGDLLLPTIGDVLDWVNRMLAGFQAMPTEMQSNIVSIAAWTAAAGPMLIIGGKIISMFGTLAGVMSGPAGWIALGVAGAAALTTALAKMGETGDALERSMKKVDQRELAAFTEAFAKVDLNAKVTDNATPTIKSAVGNLKAVLLGIDVLTDEERQQIISLVGQDVDPILQALNGAGVDTTTDEGSAIAGKITSAAVTLHKALMDASLVGKDMDLKGLATAIEGGREAIIKALTDAGVSQTDAETAAKKIITAKDELTAACSGLDGIVPADIAATIATQKSSLVTALQGMGLSSTDIAAVVQSLSTAQTTLGSQVSSIYDTIFGKLTDGKPDTKEQTAELKKLAQEYFDGLMAELDLNTEAGQGYAASLKSLQDDTLAYITKMSGASTEAVQVSQGKLDALAAEAKRLHGEIMSLVAEANAETDSLATRMVKAGVSSAPEIVAEAFGGARSKYDADRTRITENANRKKQDTAELWGQEEQAAGQLETESLRKAAYDAAEEKYRKALEAIKQAESEALQNAETEYKQESNKLFQGLVKNTAKDNPELVAALSRMFESLDLSEALKNNVLPNITEGFGKGEGLTLTPDQQTAMMQGLVGSMFEGWSPDALLRELDIGGMVGTEILAALSQAQYDLEQSIDKEYGNTDTGTLGITLNRLIAEGWLGDTDIDTESIRGKLTAMLGKLDVPGIINSTLAEQLTNAPETTTPITTTPEIDVDPTVDASAVQPAIEDAVKGEVAPVDADVTVNASVNISANGGGSGEADGSAYAKALAGTSGQASGAGKSVSSAATKALGGQVGAARTAGAQLGAGFVAGMASKLGAAISKAAQLARAAINAINAEAEVASPSKKTTKSGAWTGEGYVVGLRSKLSDVIAISKQLGAAGVEGMQMAPTRIDPSLLKSYQAQQVAAYGMAGGGMQQPGNNNATGPSEPGIAIHVHNPVVRNDRDARGLMRTAGKYINQVNAGYGGRRPLRAT